MALYHADRNTKVTAQEAYDAFMNTRVFIYEGKITYEAVNMVWYDNNSSQNDPTNVGYVRLSYVHDDNSGGAAIGTCEVGNASLVPTG